MKKIYTATLLLFTVFLLLTGCSGKTIESESEPDTDTKTQVHALKRRNHLYHRHLGTDHFLLAALISINAGVPVPRNLCFLPLPLPGGGIGFWIMTVILGILAFVAALTISGTANGNGENSLKYLLGSLLLGVCYLPWCASVVFLFVELIGGVIQGIGVVLLCAVVIFGFVSLSGSKDSHDNDQSAQSVAGAYRRDGDSDWCYLVSSSGDNHAVIRDESGNFIEIRRHGNDGLFIDDHDNLYRPE